MRGADDLRICPKVGLLKILTFEICLHLSLQCGREVGRSSGCLPCTRLLVGVMRERSETRPSMFGWVPTAAFRDYRAGSFFPILTSCLRQGALKPVHSNDKRRGVVEVFSPGQGLVGAVSASLNSISLCLKSILNADSCG